MRAPKLQLQDLQEKILSGSKFVARMALKELQGLPNSDPKVWELRGTCHGILGATKEAAKHYYEAYSRSGSPRHLGLYGSTLIEIPNDQDKAEGLRILKGLESDRIPLAAIYSSLALYYWDQEDPQSALEALARGIGIRELIHKHPVLLMMSAYTHYVCDQQALAEELTRKAFEQLLNRQIESLKELSPESVRSLVETHLEHWTNHGEDLEAYIALVSAWSKEFNLDFSDDEEDELISRNHEFCERLDEVAAIDWSAITPNMYMTADDFHDEIMGFAREIANQAKE